MHCNVHDNQTFEMDFIYDVMEMMLNLLRHVIVSLVLLIELDRDISVPASRTIWNFRESLSQRHWEISQYADDTSLFSDDDHDIEVLSTILKDYEAASGPQVTIESPSDLSFVPG